MLSGDNGILQKATDAKTNTEKAQIKERIQLAYHSALARGQGSYTKGSIEDELEKEFGENNYNVDDSDSDNWVLTAKGQSVTIPAGKKEDTPSGKLSEEALRTKITNETEDCMIDEDGNIIPINIWNWRSINDTECKICAREYWDDENDEEAIDPSYYGEIIDGLLQYNIPIFIKSSNKVYKVKELDGEVLENAVYVKDELREIKIPNNIEVIFGSCFKNCSNLKSVTLPNSLTMIGAGVFAGCDGLEEIEIPSSVKRIESGVFKGCSKLKNVILNDGIEEIEDEAFRNCLELENITIPRSILTIQGFQNLDATHTQQAWGSFSGCSSLTEIVIYKAKDSVSGAPWGAPNITADDVTWNE